jgi:hypothetical protein
VVSSLYTTNACFGILDHVHVCRPATRKTQKDHRSVARAVQWEARRRGRSQGRRYTTGAGGPFSRQRAPGAPPPRSNLVPGGPPAILSDLWSLWCVGLRRDALRVEEMPVLASRDPPNLADLCGSCGWSRSRDQEGPQLNFTGRVSRGAEVG